MMMQMLHRFPRTEVEDNEGAKQDLYKFDTHSCFQAKLSPTCLLSCLFPCSFFCGLSTDQLEFFFADLGRGW